MKLGYDLAPEQRTKLEGLKILLAKPAKQYATSISKVTHLREAQTKAIARRRKLEAEADGTDEKKAATLAGVRHQLLLLDGSISRGEAQWGPEFLTTTQRTVRQAHAALIEILRPMADRHLGKLAALLEPFCESPRQAEMIVQNQIPSYRHVLTFCTREQAGSMNDVASALALAAEKLQLTERLLAGEDVLPDYAETVAALERGKRRPVRTESPDADQFGPQPVSVTAKDNAGLPVQP